jgi:hypothetical protein
VPSFQLLECYVQFQALFEEMLELIDLATSGSDLDKAVEAINRLRRPTGKVSVGDPVEDGWDGESWADIARQICDMALWMITDAEDPPRDGNGMDEPLEVHRFPSLGVVLKAARNLVR